MAEGIRLGGGRGKSFGKNAWIKRTVKTQEVLSNPTIKLIGVDSSYKPTIFSVSGLNTDWVIDESYFDGFTYDKYTFSYSEGILTCGSYTVTYDATNMQLTFSSSLLAISQKTFTYKGEKTVNLVSPVGDDIVGFLVDDNPDKYPDRAVSSDGYWYEKFIEGGFFIGLFGCSEVAVDKFMNATQSSFDDLSIPHSLGKVPKVAIIIAYDINPKVTGDSVFWIGLNSLIGNRLAYCYVEFQKGSSDTPAYISGGGSNTTTIPNFTDTTITPDSAGYATAGVEYALITMA